jgi:hypothetical protein
MNALKFYLFQTISVHGPRPDRAERQACGPKARMNVFLKFFPKMGQKTKTENFSPNELKTEIFSIIIHLLIFYIFDL